MDYQEWSLDPETVWKQCWLEPAAVERVIMSAGLPIAVADEHREALRLTLAKLTGLIFRHSLYWRAPAEKQQHAARAFLALLPAMTDLSFSTDPPPLMPEDWLVPMHAWALRVLYPTESSKGPVKHLDQLAYPMLLGFFELAYEQEPTATLGGPALRFVGSFFDEMAEPVAGMRLDSAKGPGAGLQKRWKKPKPEALRMKIRKRTTAGNLGKAAPVLFACFVRGLRHLPGGPGEVSPLH